MSYNNVNRSLLLWPTFILATLPITKQSSYNYHRKFVILLLSFCLIICCCCSSLCWSHIHYHDHHHHHTVDEEYLDSRKELPCGHIPPKLNQIRFAHIDVDNNEQNDNDDHHIINKRNEPKQQQRYQNLRIKYFYDESVEKITKEKYLIIDKVVLPEAINYWQQALFVKPFNVPIKLNRRCIRDNPEFLVNQDYCIEGCEQHTFCGEVVIPDEHLEDCVVCDEHGRDCLRQKTSSTNHSLINGINDADFVFYISTLQSTRCGKGSTIAYAAHCQQETHLNRPIAGHANICPDSISTKPQDLETLISTFKHEILHALGFSVSLYAFYLDPNGSNPTIDALKNQQNKHSLNNNRGLLNGGGGSGGGSMLMISKKILQRVPRKNWMVRGGNITNNVFVISTPNVLREVRNHFNCSKLEGAELENQGEDGTLLTHWEKRLFENEAMTGTHTQNPVYSRITLALMEDTGWYKVNYSLAQPLEWGRNLGCDFAMKSCKEWIDTKRRQGKSIHPFCDRVKKDPLQTECTDNRDSVALCNLRQYDEKLDRKFQNFDDIKNISHDSVSYFGGSVILADYCPYIQEFTWKQNNETVRGSKCSYPENNPSIEKNFALEHYGIDSKCMNHGDEMWVERTCQEIRQWQHWGSGCYQYRCTEDGFISILIANHTYICLYDNQEIKIQLFYNNWLHKGSIICPKCTELCSNCKILDSENLDRLKNVTVYDRDHLKCSSTTPKNYSDSFFIIYLILSVIFIYFSS
uniref:Leishmanolysin-like peptidase n=1 Tax=Dermatophagoides pteronyssinus TaxID=6956 RepID=A0A6P6XTJ6_DERPT|nr:leishmanolysin-like peptidase [Dermatophagoides pteronyssinus]